MVEIEGLSAGYAGRTVLALPRFRVAPGQHTLVLGPSGSGKTTLLNVLAGIVAPAAGSVHINNELVTAMPPAARDAFRGRHIGLVMQRLHLIAALDVAHNLKLAQALAGLPVDRARIAQVLAALGVEHKAHAKPRQLSQGEAQRVAIARAVLNRPALILGDEPTAALDDANCDAAISLLFAQATETGATLIVATHDARIKPRFAQVLELGSTA